MKYLPLIGLVTLMACATPQTPVPVVVKSPETILAERIQSLHADLERLYRSIEANNPLYLGEMRTVFEDLEKLGGANGLTRLNHAQILVFEGRHEEAMAVFQGMSKESTTVDWVRHYAEALRVSGQLAKAKQVVLSDYEKYPERLASLSFAARIAWDEGEKEQALSWSKRVLRENPLDSAALEVALLHALNEKNVGLARLILRRAEHGGIQSPDFSRLAGDLEVQMGQEPAALKAYSHGLELFPQSLKLREAAAATALSLGAGKRAHDHYTWLLSRDPKEVAWYLGLAISARMLGRPAEAAQLYARALELDPHSKEALWNDGVLAQVYQGEFTRAYARWSKLRQALTTAERGDFAELDERLLEVEQLAEQERAWIAEEEAEQRAQHAIADICSDLARARTPDFSKIPTATSLADAGWDLMAQANLQWDEAPGQAMAQAACAFVIAERAPEYEAENCAPMHYSWGLKMHQAGDGVEAMRHASAALACDPNHKNARVLQKTVSAQ